MPRMTEARRRESAGPFLSAAYRATSFSWQRFRQALVPTALRPSSCTSFGVRLGTSFGVRLGILHNWFSWCRAEHEGKSTSTKRLPPRQAQLRLREQAPCLGRPMSIQVWPGVSSTGLAKAYLRYFMSTTIRAAFVYFALVLGTGFVLGMFRVPFLVPRLGERWAELAEMPIMAVVIFFAAGYILRRFPEIRSPARSLVAGLLAFALSIAAELLLATMLQDRTVAEFLSSRDKISGSVYLALLVAFAVMPRLRLLSHGSVAQKASKA
jgi:hypothetical protein